MIRMCPPLMPVGCSVVSGAAGSVGSDVATALVKAVTSGVAAAAGWLVGHLISLVSSTTTVDLGAPWFIHREQAMVSLMAILIVPLLLAGTISAIIRQDLRRLARTWAVALPVAVVITVAVINLTQLALGAADAMTSVVTHNADLGVYAAFAKLLVAESATGGPPFVALIIAVAVIFGALFVWLELVVRSAAVYVAVFFLPLALAGLVWPATAHMAKRLVEGLAALILAKFVIVATLTLGAGAVASVRGVDQVAAGTAILFVAAFAPFVLFRMVPIIEASALAHLEGLSRRPARALTSGAQQAAALTGPTGAALNAVRTAGQGAQMAPSAVAAQTIAMAKPTYDPATGGPPKPEEDNQR
ncbi:MAG: hypothetical protein M3063_15275 [Actinomycetota bacterium]|nr:hypothetical protein [Actinomycetota bacterium]MDQ6946723.1 hypothetical protein [Actinomycetota bacterium]